MVEMLSVIALIAVCSALMLPTYFSEQEHQQIADAVVRGQQIASSIETSRSLGVVSEFSGSLAEYIAVEDHQVVGVASMLSDEIYFFGVAAQDLYRIEVKEHGVRVSFGLVGDRYKSYRFPSARTSVVPPSNDQPFTTVSWSMGPSYVNGLNLVYGVSHYINVN